jgi:hypothetical protein
MVAQPQEAAIPPSPDRQWTVINRSGVTKDMFVSSSTALEASYEASLAQGGAACQLRVIALCDVRR